MSQPQPTVQQMVLSLKSKLKTQAEIARRLGVHPSSVSAWKRSKWSPSLLNYEKLVKLYNDEIGEEKDVRMKWRWEQDNGDISWEVVYIPLSVWKTSVNAIGEFVTDYFAKKWVASDPARTGSYGYYFVAHLPGFTQRIRANIQMAYAKKQERLDRRGS